MYIKKQESVKPYDKMVKTVCALCPSGCGMKIYLKEGKIIDVWGDEDHPNNKGSLCPKGMSVTQYLYEEQRCLYPMIRSNLTEDFQRVTWDEALDFVKGRLEKVRDKNGPESLCIYPSTHTSFSNLMCSLRFGKLFSTPNLMNPFSKGLSPLALVSHSIFGSKGIGCLMCPPQYWSESQSILVVESDITASDTMSAGFILDAIERGFKKKLIVVNSKETMLMSKAEIPIRIKPGTAVALIMGMGYVIHDEELHDTSFIKKWSSGFKDWLKACEQYPPEKVQKMTGVPASRIREVAKIFATNRPSQVVCGSFSNHFFTSVDLLWACSALVTSTGSIGVLGGGLTTLGNSPFFDPFAGLKEVSPSKKSSLTETWDDSKLFKSIREGEPYSLQAIIWDGNPISQLPNLKDLAQSLNKMDLIVHLTSHFNLTSRYAHAIFPMAVWLETDGLLYRSNFRTLQWHKKAINSMGESRDHADFWLKLAVKFNYESHFPWMDEKGSSDIKKMANFYLKSNHETAGITVDLLDEDKPLGGIFWPCPNEENATFQSNTTIKEEPTIRGYGHLFRAGTNYPGENKRFPTPSGKIELSPDAFEKRGWGRHPIFHEFSIGLQKDFKKEKEDAFPLMMTLGRLINSIPEAGLSSLGLKKGVKFTHLVLQINPRLAKLLDLNNGEEVVLESPSGKLETPVWINQNIDPGYVWCKEGTEGYCTDFPYASAAGLIDIMDNNNGRGPRRMNLAMVRIYKKGTDPYKTAKIIGDFLHDL